MQANALRFITKVVFEYAWNLLPRSLILLTAVVVLAGCATAVSPAPATQPAPTPSSMIAPTPTVHMIHGAPHGGQLGMSKDLHIEIVSERPGEYKLYLYDPAGNPLPSEGTMADVALIDSTGKRLSVFPARLADRGEYFFATGGPTDIIKSDVRVTVALRGKNQPVEMDFTLQYQAGAAPTPTVRATPTVPAARPPATAVPGQRPAVQWSQTQGGLTVGVFFAPYPLQLGGLTTFRVILTDAAGQPITDATVELVISTGMAGMEGEHDDTVYEKLESQGGGVYVTRTLAGRADQTLTGLSLNIQRGAQIWAVLIRKDELQFAR